MALAANCGPFGPAPPKVDLAHRLKVYAGLDRKIVKQRYLSLCKKAQHRSGGVCKSPKPTTDHRVLRLPVELQLEILNQLPFHEAHRLIVQDYSHLIDRWIHGSQLRISAPRWLGNFCDRDNFRYLGFCGFNDNAYDCRKDPSRCHVYRPRSLDLHPDIRIPSASELGWELRRTGVEDLAPSFLESTTSNGKKMESAKSLLEGSLVQLCCLYSKGWHIRDEIPAYCRSVGPPERFVADASFQGPLKPPALKAILLPMDNEQWTGGRPGFRISHSLLVFEDELEVLIRSIAVLTSEDFHSMVREGRFVRGPQDLSIFQWRVLQGNGVANVCCRG